MARKDKKTQEEVVLDILLKKGSISNHFCIDRLITTRLGAIIHKLRAKGYFIAGEFKRNKDSTSLKNFVYTLIV